MRKRCGDAAVSGTAREVTIAATLHACNLSSFAAVMLGVGTALAATLEGCVGMPKEAFDEAKADSSAFEWSSAAGPSIKADDGADGSGRGVLWKCTETAAAQRAASAAASTVAAEEAEVAYVSCVSNSEAAEVPAVDWVAMRTTALPPLPQ